MSANIIPKFEFTHYETCLIAFFSDLERKIHIFNNKIPVLFNVIDQSYYLVDKYKKLPKDKVQELYNVVPRITLKIMDISSLMETLTPNYIKQNIIIKDKSYEVTFRSIENKFNFDMNFVASNFIMGLRYLEILNTIFCEDNTFTYIYDGNNYDAQYAISTNFILDQTDPNFSNESSNAFIKGNIELTFKPSFYNIKNLLNKFMYNNNVQDLIDTDVLVNNETNKNIELWLDNSELINSKLNSQQNLNDLSLSDKEEDELLAKSHTKKIANKITIIKPDKDKEQLLKSKGLSDEK